MYLSTLRPVARLFGISPAAMNDREQCARALVGCWNERQLSYPEIEAISGISPHTYREILRVAGGDTKCIPFLPEPEPVAA